MKINKDDAVFIGIDFQTKLVPPIYENEKLVDVAIRLIKGARVFGAPIIMSQQYTKGLGPTVEPIEKALTEELFDGLVPAAEFTPYDKTTFSAMREPEFAKAVEATGRKTAVVFGMETHICVLQTVLDLLDAGYKVYVVADGVSSRSASDRKYGIMRMKQEGALIATYEDVLFEMLEGKNFDGFKQISNIVK